MITKEKTINEAVSELANLHYSYMRNLDGFPSVCDWSSHMMGSYLSYKGYKVEVVYGTFGTHDLFHAWLKCGEKILDFTLLQFLTPKQKQNFYKKMTDEEFMNYIIKHQGSYWIDKNHPNYHDYKEMTIIQHQFNREFEKGEIKDYKTFYENIWYSDGYHRFGIKTASLKNENKTFQEKLDELDLRIGKKFFSKLCIVKK